MEVDYGSLIFLLRLVRGGIIVCCQGRYMIRLFRGGFHFFSYGVFFRLKGIDSFLFLSCQFVLKRR